jgi:hypothetical protein
VIKIYKRSDQGIKTELGNKGLKKIPEKRKHSSHHPPFFRCYVTFILLA